MHPPPHNQGSGRTGSGLYQKRLFLIHRGLQRLKNRTLLTPNRRGHGPDRGRHRLPKNGGTLEKAAMIANHASTRTTQLYGRRSDEVSLDEVERILI